MISGVPTVTFFQFHIFSAYLYLDINVEILQEKNTELNISRPIKLVSFSSQGATEADIRIFLFQYLLPKD